MVVMINENWNFCDFNVALMIVGAKNESCIEKVVYLSRWIEYNFLLHPKHKIWKEIGFLASIHLRCIA
jgi:hypothetical protein